MKKTEEILELLSKEELSNNERNRLNELVETDAEMRNFYNSYKSIKNIVKSSAHLSYDELSNYILYKNGETPDDKSIIKRVPFIEAHLRECKKCTEDFKLLNSEYSDAVNFIDSEFREMEQRKSDKIKNSSKTTVGIFQSKFYSASRYAFAAILAVALLYAGLFVTSNFTTPDIYELAALEDDDSGLYVTRGRATDNFQEGIKAIENENYDQAISHFKNDIDQNINDNTLFYSYYILGLTYLESAESDFIGLFPSYNIDKVDIGIENLKSAIENNTSGKFNNITLDAYFYLAKANLIKGNNNEAKRNLLLVVEQKGSKMAEAKRILEELE